MAAPSYTYTLTNSSTADASQVMQNYNDILNGVTDGTKDLTINALTCNGTVSFKGNVTLGDASADDVTFTGSLASSIGVKTTATYNVGDSTHGLLSIYFGRNSQTVRIVPSATMSATWTMTLPTTAGAGAGYLLSTDGAGVTSWTDLTGSAYYASGTTAGTISGTTQTIAGAKTWSNAATFSSSITVGGNTTSDANLGTISSVSLSEYYRGSFSVTFDAGFGTSQAVTVQYVRIGRIVSLNFPAFTATGANPGVAAITNSSGFGSSLRPAVRTYCCITAANAGTNFQGNMRVDTTGAIKFFKGFNETDTYTNGASIGWEAFSISYIV